MMTKKASVSIALTLMIAGGYMLWDGNKRALSPVDLHHAKKQQTGVKQVDTNAEYVNLIKRQATPIEIFKLNDNEHAALVEKNNELDQKMAKIITDYNDNLSDLEEREKIERQLKQSSDEYKATVLKLAKNELAQREK